MQYGRRAAVQLSAAALILLAVLAGCGSDDGRALESKALVPQPPGDLNGTEWLLVAKGDTDAVPAARTATIRFEQEHASGAGPCNRYRVPFAVDGTDATTGTVAATKIACPEPNATAERRFFDALEAVDTAERQDDRLVLTGPDDTRLVFEEAQDAADGLPGSWRVVNIATARALATAVANTAPTFDFHDDGTLTIFTGCNTANASWTAKGQSVRIGAVRSTFKACTDPPGVGEQEAAILHAIERTVRAEPTDHEAVLLDASGAKTFVLDREE